MNEPVTIPEDLLPLKKKEKVLVKNKAAKKSKKNKKDNLPKITLFLVILSIAILCAFILRAQRAMFVKQNPGQEYNKAPESVETAKEEAEDFITSWKLRIEELLPEKLPSF